MRRLLPTLLVLAACSPRPDVLVGSKKFTESVVLGEIVTQLVAARGVRVEHRRELGGTRILWNALVAGEIDTYPEYTGTLRQEIVPGDASKTREGLAVELAKQGVSIVGSLGFDDTYAIGMTEANAARLGITTLSELARHPEVVLGLSHEFLDRDDGWAPLKARYGLAPKEVRGLDHDVAYRALASGAIGATDLYSTDAEIRTYGLRVLVDDLHHFPAYEAVLLARQDLAQRAPAAASALLELANKISATQMIALNARAAVDKIEERRVAAEWLVQAFGVAAAGHDPGRVERIWARTREHLLLVAISLIAALIAAIPLGVVAAKWPRMGQLLLGGVGILQTVPSLALLVLLIPALGIGAAPALACMFLYSLLPIMRNTAAGITDLPGSLRESAEALGLSPWARLWRVELPLASRAILAGIKTSAVLNVGTATLGALIGAGGYGQPILAGIRRDDMSQIFEGAIPAALLALIVQWAFELAEMVVVPRGLRLPPSSG